MLSAESTTKAMAAAGSSQRPGEVLYRLQLRAAGDRKSGKGYQTLELWFQNYPRGEDPSALDLLGGPFHPWNWPF